jgi:protoheme IX farnesyltransferase
MTNSIKNIINFTKMKISIAAMVLTGAGFLLAANQTAMELIYVCLGVFLLSSGSAALNQFQERDIDARMERTKDRPLPKRILSTTSAVILIIAFVVIGLTILFVKTNIAAFTLGALTLVMYNFIYTPLKRKTVFAILPGSLVGALLPAIGWAAAGHSIIHPEIMAVAFFVFVWQVPHFLLLLVRHQDDYEMASLPTLMNQVDSEQFGRIVFTWLTTTAVACLFILSFVSFNTTVLQLLMLALPVWLVWFAFRLLNEKQLTALMLKSFKRINMAAYLIITILIADKLF